MFGFLIVVQEKRETPSFKRVVKGADIGITPGKKTKLLRPALLKLLLAALKKKVF